MEVRRGCLTFPDGMIYCLDNRGTTSPVRPSTEESKAISRFSVPRRGRGIFSAHPVVWIGRGSGPHSSSWLPAAPTKDSPSVRRLHALEHTTDPR